MAQVISIPSLRLWKHYGNTIQFSRRRKRIGAREWKGRGRKDRENRREEGEKKCSFRLFFLWKKVWLCVCLLWRGSPPWQRPQKPSFIYPEYLALLEKRLWKAGSHHMCQGDMAFPLLTLQSEGLLLLKKEARKRSSTSVVCICISLLEITMQHLTRWKENILSEAWETHPINDSLFSFYPL